MICPLYLRILFEPNFAEFQVHIKNIFVCLQFVSRNKDNNLQPYLLES